MNGPADPSENPPLRILLETPGNPPMVWKVPASGLVLGSALGCDIRLPVELPPVALMVIPHWDSKGCSARIRALAPLMEITHNGQEWTGEALPPGESLRMGSVSLKLLNANAHRFESPVQAPEPQSLPKREEPGKEDPLAKPKKKISWLKRWQRSLELRESTLLVSKSWGSPPIPPVPDFPVHKQEPAYSGTPQIPAAMDKNWKELEDWIQAARTQAEACAQERERLKKIQEEADALQKDLEASLLTMRLEKEEFHRFQQEYLDRQERANQALEEARLALVRQASQLADERSSLKVDSYPIEMVDPQTEPALQSNEPTESLPSLWEAMENSRFDNTSLQGSLPEYQPGFEPGPDGSEELADAQRESLGRQLAKSEDQDPADHSDSALGGDTPRREGIPPSEPEAEGSTNLGTDVEPANPKLTSNVFLETPEEKAPYSIPNETLSDLPPLPVPIDTIRVDPTPPAGIPAEEIGAQENEVYLEDQENFLPQPELQALEAFQQWCQARLGEAAEKLRLEHGLDESHQREDYAHRQGFARKLVEQNLTTPRAIQSLARLSATQGIPLEDLLVRLGVFTTHQVATMGLGCANDLVLGRWFILELPAIDSMDLDREIVFRVFDPKENVNRVLRLLAPGEAKKAGQAAEYRERHLACSRIDSEHLVGTLEVSELGGLPCVLQEDSGGVSSENWPPLGASATVWYRLFLQAAVALRDLHEKGLSHGHLEPADFLLQPEGLLQIAGAGTPSWLCQGGPFPTSSPSQDLADLARISHAWWTGKDGENPRYLPEPLAGILARLESGHQNSIHSARALAEELDRAGILLPSGASAWQRFLEELNGPETVPPDASTDDEDPDSEVLRQSA